MSFAYLVSATKMLSEITNIEGISFLPLRHRRGIQARCSRRMPNIASVQGWQNLRHQSHLDQGVHVINLRSLSFA